jgi:hypothetical protein
MEGLSIPGGLEMLLFQCHCFTVVCSLEFCSLFPHFHHPDVIHLSAEPVYPSSHRPVLFLAVAFDSFSIIDSPGGRLLALVCLSNIR